MEVKSDIVIIDWLTWTSRTDSVDSIKQLLGMQHMTWERIDRGLMGYTYRHVCGHVMILCGGTDDMGICCNMSGQACREFESYGNASWSQLLSALRDDEEVNITRIDLAYDDHSGILDMDQLLDDVDDGNYTQRGRWWKLEYGSCGTCIYFGAPTSNTRVRIYDKAMERGITDGTHWVRVELQLRSDIAAGAVGLLEYNPVGTVMFGLLRNYLLFRTPSADSNKSRWPIAEYWERLLDGVNAMSAWSDPGVDYNVFRLERYLVDQVGPSLVCWETIIGLDDLLEKIRHKHRRLSPKYERLMSDYFTALYSYQDGDLDA